MAQLATLEAKMASIEVSLSAANTPRRRKGTSLGGGSSISARASPRLPSTAAISVAEIQQPHLHNHGHHHHNHHSMQQHHQQQPTKEMRTALQDREAVIQNLRMQLGLGKMPRPLGNAPLDDAERPAAEQQLARLKHDADIKRVQIRNLKLALDKLDITDNIDARIRQAELEYALGREELQMLSLVEEARALQTRMDKSRPEANSLYSTMQAGTQLCLQAVQATVGRWAACAKAQAPGMWIEWALDGEGLYRGDRILEVNGAVLTCRTREELHKLVGLSGKCQLVVVRKRTAPVHQQQQQQQLVQSQEDNTRLQHRICYLEDQVKEMLHTAKEAQATVTKGSANAAHVTSISISTPSPPLNGAGSNGGGGGSSSSGGSSGGSGGEHKPQIFQRGSYVTTIIGGMPTTAEGTPQKQQNKAHITKTIIKDAMHTMPSVGITSNGNGISRTTSSHQLLDVMGRMSSHSKALSASKISINSDTTHIKRDRHREARRLDEHQHQQLARSNGGDSVSGDRERRHQPLSEYAAAANGTDTENRTSSAIGQNGHGPKAAAGAPSSSSSRNHHRSRHSEGGQYGFSSYARSVEQLNLANGHSEHRRREDRLLSAAAATTTVPHASNGQYHYHRHKIAADMRSVKSLDFDSDAGGGGGGIGTGGGSSSNKRDVDYTSEPVAHPHRVRPTPPKKPLRLSLQRAQSLQTVEANLAELDRKRAMKRTHKGTSSEMLQFIENNVPFHTASLGRNNYV